MSDVVWRKIGEGIYLKSKRHNNTSNTHNTMTVTRFGVSFPKALAKRLDQIRGDVSRSVFLQNLVREELESAK